jgi:hypothetical protein
LVLAAQVLHLEHNLELTDKIQFYQAQALLLKLLLVAVVVVDTTAALVERVVQVAAVGKYLLQVVLQLADKEMLAEQAVHHPEVAVAVLVRLVLMVLVVQTLQQGEQGVMVLQVLLQVPQ